MEADNAAIRPARDPYPPSPAAKKALDKAVERAAPEVEAFKLAAELKREGADAAWRS